MNNTLNNQGAIFNIQRYSIHDGPGIRTVIFLKGCPLRCVWCCNPEGQSDMPQIRFIKTNCIGCMECVKACPTGALSFDKGFVYKSNLCNLCKKCVEVCFSNARLMVGENFTVEEVIKEVNKDKDFYINSGGGVTLSGGEVLSQWYFATLLLKAFKTEGINTAIETTGCGSWKHFKSVLRYTDFVFYDIKHMNSERHKQLTGVDNKLLLKNAQKASSLVKEFVLRLTVVPNYNNESENIIKTAEFACSLPNLKEVQILPYHKLGISKYKQMGMNYKLTDVKPPTIMELESIVNIFRQKGLNAKIVKYF